MTVSPETLLAFVEGELSPEEARKVAAEVANDPSLTAHVENHRALKARLQAASLVGAEPVFAAAASPPAPPADPAPQSAGPHFSPWLSSSLLPAGAMAAGIALGVLLAISFRPGTEIRTAGGAVVADGMLARALSTVIATERNGAAFAPSQIGESFFIAEGYFCRNFATAPAGKAALAGIACREGEDWHIRVLASIEAPESDKAAADKNDNKAPPLPPAVRDTLNALMVGQPLDADGERAARAQSWLVR